MKFKYKDIAKIFLLGLLVISIGSCKKDGFLDVPAKSILTSKSTFETQANAELFVNEIYKRLPDGNDATDQTLEGWTDNNNCTSANHQGQNKIRSNALSAGNSTTGPGDQLGWSQNYTNIRSCNVFLKEAEANKSVYDAAWYAQRVAEVKAMRAFFYSILFRNYGALPLITSPLNNKDGSDILYARSTIDQTVAFIEADCDAASAVLPLTQSAANIGRITKGAALMIKGDVQLFAASSLVNKANDLTKWAKAAATLKSVMDLGTYSLFTKSSATPIISTTGSGTTSTAYRDQFLAENNWNSETILARGYALPGKGHRREGFMGPVVVNGGVQAWGGFSPTQGLVDDYEMDNGKPIEDPTSGYDPQHPYLHRESRFEQSIIYDGSYWQGDIMKTRLGGSNEIDLGGKGDISNTGYYARKTLDESIKGQASFARPNISNYIFYRYAETLLSYAEAQNEAAGPDASVYDAVKQVRARVLLPALPAGLSQDNMRTAIRRERRIELAFEDRRWYDIRRWEITAKGPAVLTKPMYGMLITPNGNNLTYAPVVGFQNSYSDYMNWLPIPADVLNANPKLVQNTGY
ncbi:RagB/SusD family nutrient uptake outer membrane protein [Mucilaginibacter sp. UYCu711]|uniref:RagB/SusD family nutrient uptake outer membrane protein n=1 Tax=Mucilaginibacter sp. UYCu711 TaxID=3156339 RepID=UPI003D23DA14